MLMLGLSREETDSSELSGKPTTVGIWTLREGHIAQASSHRRLSGALSGRLRYAMNIKLATPKQRLHLSGWRQTRIFGFAIGILLGLLIPSPSAADDTEIFMTQFSGTGVSGGRPKVLIIFDNSGSMRDGVPQSKPDYDPNMNWTDPVAVEAAFEGAGMAYPITSKPIVSIGRLTAIHPS
jgi:hypothetical protein